MVILGSLWPISSICALKLVSFIRQPRTETMAKVVKVKVLDPRTFQRTLKLKTAGENRPELADIVDHMRGFASSRRSQQRE